LTCGGHARPVVNLSFSDITTDGVYYMLSASKDGQPMLRQGDTGDWIGTFLGHKGAVWGCALNSDATKAATASADFTAKFWDAASGDELHTFSMNYIVRAIDLDKKGVHLMLASKQQCYMHDMNRIDADPITWEAHGGNVKRCAYVDENQNCALTAGEDNKIRLWDLRQPLSTFAREADLSGLPFGDFSIDRLGSKSMYTVACGRQIRFYDTNFHLLKSFDAPTPVYSAALAPDGESFVFGGEDFKIYRYRFDDFKEIDNCKGHFGPVHCVRFSPDGELYASGSEDGTVRLWQTHLGKDYGLWKVDRSIPASLPSGAIIGFPLSSSPNQAGVSMDSPHVITVSSSNVPIIVVPKSPTSPRMPH